MRTSNPTHKNLGLGRLGRLLYDQPTQALKAPLEPTGSNQASSQSPSSQRFQSHYFSRIRNWRSAVQITTAAKCNVCNGAPAAPETPIASITNDNAALAIIYSTASSDAVSTPPETRFATVQTVRFRPETKVNCWPSP